MVRLSRLHAQLHTANLQHNIYMYHSVHTTLDFNPAIDEGQSPGKGTEISRTISMTD